MNRSLKILFLCFTLVILMANIAHAVCVNKGGGVWETADNTAEAVNVCVGAASAGDTINVKAGLGAVTWPAAAVTIPSSKPLQIIGPGRDNLSITLGGSYAFLISPYVGTPELPATRISGFKFISPYEAKRVAIQARGQGWRIDHCAYEGIESQALSSTSIFVIASGVNTTVEPYGLVDNNIIINGKVVPNGFSTFIKESGVWSEALGLGTANAVYIENNHFISNKAERKLFVDLTHSGKYVVRYNTFVNGWILAHGLQTDSMRGTRHWEIYGNAFSTPTTSYNAAIALLSGTGVVFNNDFTGVGSFLPVMEFGHERSNAAIGAAGRCDGTSGWDGNLDATGWPCRDQIGTSTDASLWSSSATLPAPVQTLAPAYVWSLLDNGALKNPAVSHNAPTHIRENRDYYRYNTTSCAAGGASCTAGVGCGTLTNRPATCTPGVAYWATNQSCTDMTSMVGANPSTPISGTLYKCTAPNTWTVHYTPYTYPHPLRSGVQPPAPPQTFALTTSKSGTGTITSNPAGINCGSTCTYSFTSGELVTLTATPGSGYTFSNWTGACTGTGTCSVTMSQIRSVTATFAVVPQLPSSYSLTVSRTGTGNGAISSAPSGINCGTSCSAAFSSGVTVQLTATPDASSTFAGWSGACTGTTSCAVTMNEVKTVIATFTANPAESGRKTLTVVKNGNGKVRSVPSAPTQGSVNPSAETTAIYSGDTSTAKIT